MSEFSFSSNSIANDYDDVLVPIIFKPWALKLIDHHSDWEGKHVLDIASGTGIVTRSLAERIGSNGSIIAADINPAMLDIAKQRCADMDANISFVVSPAEPLDVPDDSVDIITCQQGLQFFPDKPAAASEMNRVLKDGGHVMVSTWRPVSECDSFGAICEALESIDESDISNMMRVPFDFLSDTDLAAAFETAGFNSVHVENQSMDFVFDGDIEKAVNAAYATPISSQLCALSDQKQEAFRTKLAEIYTALSNGENTLGKLASNLLIAEK